MAIVKWLVGSWGSAPERKEYEKETPYFYIYRSGSQKRLRRDAKKSGYLSYFDSEAEALEFIRQREERRRNNKRADNIRRHGVELLDMLEEARRTLEAVSYTHLTLPTSDLV